MLTYFHEIDIEAVLKIKQSCALRCLVKSLPALFFVSILPDASRIFSDCLLPIRIEMLINQLFKARMSGKHLIRGPIRCKKFIWMNGGQWRAFKRRSNSREEIKNKWLFKSREEDRPAQSSNHFALMKEIGFTDVDVIWKKSDFVIFGGVRRYLTSTDAAKC
jgi:hypothetical protein